MPEASAGRPYIGVIGPNTPVASDRWLTAASQVGQRLGSSGAVVITGGLDGVMAAAAEGAKASGGTAVGLLPDETRAAGNAYANVQIATGLGQGRNVLVVNASDVLIAIGKSIGTLSEVALALRAGKNVVGLLSWTASEVGSTAQERARSDARLGEYIEADDVDQAVTEALGLARLKAPVTHRTVHPHDEGTSGETGDPRAFAGNNPHRADAAPVGTPPMATSTMSSAYAIATQDRSLLWLAYDFAQRHYETDLSLFGTRMNLFLLLESALVTAGLAVNAKTTTTVTLATRGSCPLAGSPLFCTHSASTSLLAAHPVTVASLGLALSLIWLMVGAASLSWIMMFREQTKALAKALYAEPWFPRVKIPADGPGQPIAWRPMPAKLVIKEGDENIDDLGAVPGLLIDNKVRHHRMLSMRSHYMRERWWHSFAFAIRPSPVITLLALAFAIAWAVLLAIHFY